MLSPFNLILFWTSNCPPAGLLRTTLLLYRVADLFVTLRWLARKVSTSLGPIQPVGRLYPFQGVATRENDPCGSGRARSAFVQIQEPDFFNTPDTVLISYAQRLHSPVPARL